MLKKRIVGVVTIRDGWAVQSIGFSRYLPLGRPEIAVEFLNDWGADEIVVVDIDASRNGSHINPDLIEKISKKAFTPLTVAGGLRSLEQVRQVLRSGADKVAIGAHHRLNPGFITEIAENFGRQCVVGVVDYCSDAAGDRVWDHVAGRSTTLDAIGYAQSLVKASAGEVFFNSVDRDGSLRGFDASFLKKAAADIGVPVIGAGGGGHPVHFREIFANTRVHAAAAGNFLYFSEHSVTTIKSFLALSDSPHIRLSKTHPYLSKDFDDRGRILPPSRLSK